jgi:hypothetical protein
MNHLKHLCYTIFVIFLIYSCAPMNSASETIGSPGGMNDGLGK